MKQLAFLFFIFHFSFLSAQKNAYPVHFRIQYADSASYCECPQGHTVQEYSTASNCNALEGVMINFYADTSLVGTISTNQNGYCSGALTPGAYRIVLHKEKYDSAAFILDVTRSSIRSLTDNKLNFSNSADDDYFICVVLDRKKKSGVRIVPHKDN